MAAAKTTAAKPAASKAPTTTVTVIPTPKGATAPPKGEVYVKDNATGTTLLRPASNPSGSAPASSSSSSSGNNNGDNGNTDSSGKPTYGAPATIAFPSTGDPALDQLGAALNTQLQNLYSQGVRLNPNITISADQAQKFLDQAVSESHPYYQGLYDSNKADIKQALGTLATTTQTSLDTTARKFNTDLRSEQDNAGETGMALSGARVRNERNLAADAQANVDTTTSNYTNAAQSQYGTAVRLLGSANATDVAPTQLNAPNIAGSFTPGQTAANMQTATRSLSPTFNLSPDVTGSLEDAQKKAQVSRAADLSSAYLQQQSRNLYGAS